MIPALDGSVILGGSRGYDSANTNVCPYEAAAIWDRGVKLLPSIGKAQILGHATGLRPHRDANVRVEMERTTAGNSNCTVRIEVSFQARNLLLYKTICEKQVTNFGKIDISCFQIVHNYGHGGWGVSTAPGTAKFAIGLAKSAHAASGSKL